MLPRRLSICSILFFLAIAAAHAQSPSSIPSSVFGEIGPGQVGQIAEKGFAVFYNPTNPGSVADSRDAGASIYRGFFFFDAGSRAPWSIGDETIVTVEFQGGGANFTGSASKVKTAEDPEIYPKAHLARIPTPVSGSPLPGGTVEIAWQKSEDANAAGYKVYRQESCGPLVEIGFVPQHDGSDPVRFSDPSPLPEASYRLRLVYRGGYITEAASDSSGSCGNGILNAPPVVNDSEALQGSTNPPLLTPEQKPPNDVARPLSVSIVKSGSDIVLNWGDVPGAVSYRVYATTDKWNWNVPYYPVISGSFTHTGAASDSNSYFYVIRSVDSQGLESSNSRVAYKVARAFNFMPGITNLHWVSVPSGTYKKATDVIADIEPTGGRSRISIVAKWNPATQSTVGWGFVPGVGWMGTDFELTERDAVYIYLSGDTPSFTWSIVGVDEPETWDFDHMSGKTNLYWTSLPHTMTMSKASDIMAAIEPAGENSKISLVAKWNPATQSTVGWGFVPGIGWMGTDFSISPGDGIYFYLSGNTRDFSWSPPLLFGPKIFNVLAVFAVERDLWNDPTQGPSDPWYQGPPVRDVAYFRDTLLKGVASHYYNDLTYKEIYLNFHVAGRASPWVPRWYKLDNANTVGGECYDPFTGNRLFCKEDPFIEAEAAKKAQNDGYALSDFNLTTVIDPWTGGSCCNSPLSAPQYPAAMLLIGLCETVCQTAGNVGTLSHEIAHYFDRWSSPDPNKKAELTDHFDEDYGVLSSSNFYSLSLFSPIEQKFVLGDSDLIGLDAHPRNVPPLPTAIGVYPTEKGFGHQWSAKVSSGQEHFVEYRLKKLPLKDETPGVLVWENFGGTSQPYMRAALSPGQPEWLSTSSPKLGLLVNSWSGLAATVSLRQDNSGTAGQSNSPGIHHIRVLLLGDYAPNQLYEVRILSPEGNVVYQGNLTTDGQSHFVAPVEWQEAAETVEGRIYHLQMNPFNGVWLPVKSFSIVETDAPPAWTPTARFSDAKGDASAAADIVEVGLSPSPVRIKIQLAGVADSASYAYVAYLDSDRNNSTGFSMQNIGADYKLEFKSGFARLYRFQDGWREETPPFLTGRGTGSVVDFAVSAYSLGSAREMDVVAQTLNLSGRVLDASPDPSGPVPSISWADAPLTFLRTHRPDYKPGEAVLLDGAGFALDTDISVRFTNSTGFTVWEGSVHAGPLGEINKVSAWQIPADAIGSYSVLWGDTQMSYFHVAPVEERLAFDAAPPVVGMPLLDVPSPTRIIRGIHVQSDFSDPRPSSTIQSCILRISDPAMLETIFPMPLAFNVEGASGTATTTVDLPFTGDGHYRFAAECSDRAGNVGTSETVSLVVDTTPPDIAILSPAGGAVFLTNQTAIVLFQTSDNLSGIGTVSATLDGQPVTNGTVVDLRTLAMGEHTVDAAATDLAGNRAATTSAFEVRPIPANVDIDPDTLNLKSQGKYLTIYIEIPGQNTSLVEVGTAKLVLPGGTVAAERFPASIGDHNRNGVPDLMVKFSRTAVQATVAPGEVSARIRGLVDRAAFEGGDSLRII